MSALSQRPAAPTILVVDDDRGLSRLVEKTLHREGFLTASVGSFSEAIEWLEQRQPDLMLLDLKLGDVGGSDLVDHLTANNRAVPFIIITGQGDERVAVAMMKRGALDYLIKDVDFLQFVPEVVRRALGQLERDKKLVAAEEALRKELAFTSAVLDTSAALVVVLDRAGQIVRFNRACEQTTGFSAAEVRGRPFWDLFLPPEEFDQVRAVFERLKSGDFPGRHENHWLTREGGRRLLAWSNSALLDDQGVVEYVISIGIDITERRRLEEELLQISDMEQSRIGQDLHDGLCQHLAAIELMGQILEQKLTKKSRADANRVAEISRQVREAIVQTRSLARGLSPVALESEGLMGALQELAAYTEKMFRVTCAFRCAEPVLIHHHDTATHLYRIAQEAVSNAIRHGKAKQIMMTLEVVGDRVHLSVKDNGIGLPEDVTSAKGMGLRIMRYRAGMIDGALSVQPCPRGGTMVSCSVRSQARGTDRNAYEHAKRTKESQMQGPHRR